MRNKTYEIVYVLKDNHKDSIEGFSLFVRRYKAKINFKNLNFTNHELITQVL